MEMQRRALYIPIFHIDANLINAKQKLAAVNQLEKWFDDGVILINMSSTARDEASAGGDSNRIRKANMQIYTATPPVTAGDPQYRKIEAALFPGGIKNRNQENDVIIVAEAAGYSAILVTADGGSRSQPGGILGNRDKLNDMLTILSPDEAVGFVRGKLQKRDDFNRQVATELDVDLPEWAGKD